MPRYKEYAGTALAALLFFALTAFLASDYIRQKSQETYLNPPPKYMEWFHFGFRESMADSLWLRWIQDADFCQVYGTSITNLNGTEAAKANPTDLTINPRHRICDNSWAFKMLDAITRLAPKFKMPYLAGSILLAVLIEDYKGADVLFDRAVEQFPNDWQILYRASYHKLFDNHEYKAGADLLLKASQLGAPPWLKMLAARSYSRAGQAEFGIKILEDLKKTLKEKAQIESVDKRIAEIRQRLDQEAK